MAVVNAVSAVDGGHWIEGSAALTDGTPLTGYRVAAIEPPPPDLDGRELGRFVREATARSALATSGIDEEGRFRLGPLWRGEYTLTLDALHGLFEVPTVHVEAPCTNATMGLEALLVVIEAPPEAFEGVARGPMAERLHVHSKDRFGRSLSGSARFDAERRMERLLPANAAYEILYERRDGRAYGAELEAGLGPGRHHVLLQELRPETGAVRERLTSNGAARGGLVVEVRVSPRVVSPEELSERLTESIRELGVRPADMDSEAKEVLLAHAMGRNPAVPRAMRRGTKLRLPGEEDTALDPAVLPGLYRVEASVLAAPPGDTSLVIARPERVEVRPGETVEIEVEITQGGRLVVGVAGRPGIEGRSAHLEFFDRADGTWQPLRGRRADAREAWVPYTKAISLSLPSAVERAFPPGPLRLRLSADGWYPAEETVTITAGETTTWSPLLDAR
ncbi:MAG: hypothetical protein AAGB93_03510 [Planctomycetota bacterium]